MLLRLSLLRECYLGFGIDALTGSDLLKGCSPRPPLLLAYADSMDRDFSAARPRIEAVLASFFDFVNFFTEDCGR